MNILLLHFIAALFLTGLTALSVGLFVLIKNRASSVNRIFSLYSFSIAWWSLFQIGLVASKDREMALLWARVEQVGVFFIPTLFVHFVICLLGLQSRKKLLIAGYTASCLFASLCPTPLMIANAVPKFYVRHYTTPGLVYPVAVLYFFICSIYGLYHLYRGYISSTGTKRNQMKYLFYGSFIGYFGGGANFLPVFDVNVPILNPFGTYAVPFYVVVTTYAILRHHLMDINIVFRRGVIYSFLVTAIMLLYFTIVWVAERIFQLTLGYQSVPLTIFALLTVALLFQPLKNRIQRFVDLYFFKGTLESLVEEKKRLQEEVRRTDQLRIAATLAAGVAHEIKNPLTSIKTFTKYLPEKKNEDGFIEKYQQVVENELGRIENLAKNLLDFARLKSPEFKKIDVHHILNETLNLIAHNLSVKNIFLRFKNKDIESETLP